MAITKSETGYTPPGGGDTSALAAKYGLSGVSAAPVSRYDPANEATWQVYRGATGPTPRFSDARNQVMAGGTRDITTGFDSTYAELFNWAQQGNPKFGQIVNLMYEANLIPAEWDVKQVQSAWAWAVAESAQRYGAGTAKMTPEEILGLAARSAAGARGGKPRGSGSGSRGSGASSRSFTQTSTSVDLSNAETAKAILNKALEDALGRAASDDEVKQFHASLNAKEQANPTKTVSQVTQLASGGGSSTSTTSGGFDGTSKMQFAQDTAKSNTEYAEYQAATTYFDAMMGALASPTGG
jgi:hypothetical protein